MTRRVRPISPLGGFAALLMALAVLMRMIVPVGYMPSQGGLVLCEGQALPSSAMQAAMPMHAVMAGEHGVMPHDKDAPGHEDRRCPFAAVGQAFDLPELTLPAILPIVPVALAAIFRLVTRPGLGLAAPPPPKTGPPLLA